MSQPAREPKPVYAVYGNDPLRKREAVEAIARLVLAKDGDGMGPTHFDGDDAGLAEVLDEVRTLSLLGGRRVVIVDDADSFISKHREALERYCAAPSDGGCLILVCDSFPATTRLHKIIAKQGEVTKFEQLKGQAVVGWMTERARTVYGKQLDGQAAWRLKDMVGASLDSLDAELGKLSIYIGTRPRIEAADVEALVGDNREQNVFGVTDAMAAGNVAEALHQWERVLATDRAAPGRAIGGLAWGIRRLMDLKEQWARGVSLETLAKQAYARPDELRRRLEGFSDEDLRRQLNALLEADLASKTGLSTAAAAIEKFIVTYSAKGERRGAAGRGRSA